MLAFISVLEESGVRIVRKFWLDIAALNKKSLP